MLWYLVRKFLGLIPTLLGVSLLSFLLIRLAPGDPIMLLLGERGADPAIYAQMKKELGLNLPMWQQYLHYLGNVLTGDFGDSIVTRQPVLKEFWGRFPATFELGLFSLLGAIVLGIPLGVWAAVRKGKLTDMAVMGGSLVGYSMPIFWWGLILILIFSVHMGITPVSGRLSVQYDVPTITGLMTLDALLSGSGPQIFWDALSHLFLPALAMGTIPLAVIARMTRSAMLEVLSEDYMRTARAKGLTRSRVLFVHGLRNALIPVITVIGLMFGSIMTGAILTETIFSWPGIGKWMVVAVNSRDYPVIQSGVLMIAAMVVITNLVVDFLYTWANPRMRGQ